MVNLGLDFLGEMQRVAFSPLPIVDWSVRTCVCHVGGAEENDFR